MSGFFFVFEITKMGQRCANMGEKRAGQFQSAQFFVLKFDPPVKPSSSRGTPPPGGSHNLFLASPKFPASKLDCPPVGGARECVNFFLSFFLSYFFPFF